MCLAFSSDKLEVQNKLLSVKCKAYMLDVILPWIDTFSEESREDKEGFIEEKCSEKRRQEILVERETVWMEVSIQEDELTSSFSNIY